MFYITEGVVIRKKEIKNSEWIITIFTKEYGKIRGFTKIQAKGGNFDIGHLVEFNIKRKNESNTFSSIHTKIAINTEGGSFEALFGFLQSISCIDAHIPENATEITIYDDLIHLIESQREKSSDIRIIRLLELRLLVILQQEIIIPPSLTIDNQIGRIAKKLEAIGRNHTLEELRRIQGIPSESFELLHKEFLRNFFPGQ